MMKLPQDPIFIVGYPRSGTTLLQRLMATQPGLYSFPETHYFSVIEKHLHMDKSGKILTFCLDNVFQKIYAKMEFQFSKEEIGTLSQASEEGKLTSKFIFEVIIAHFLMGQNPVIGDETDWRWIEKTPTHANFLHRIIEFYPGAQILHIVRHPVPAIFSRKYKFPFNKNTSLSQLANHWNNILKNVEKFSRRNPGYVYTLKYENLVKNLRNELNKIGDFLSFKFKYHFFSNLGKVPNSLFLPSEIWKLEDRNRKIVNTNDDYKNRISEIDVKNIEDIVGQKMKEFHYCPYFG